MTIFKPQRDRFKALGPRQPWSPEVWQQSQQEAANTLFPLGFLIA
jgi:hypothetical protein